MSFFRVFIGKKSGTVRHVIEEMMLFSERGARAMEWGEDSEELEEVHIGFVLHHDWTEHAREGGGDQCSPAHHFWTRIGGLTLEQAQDVIRSHPDMPKVHETPCTLGKLREHVRTKGVKSLPAVVRTWLTHTLPPHEIEALGVWRGIPLSALKAVDSIRVKRDPHGGSVRMNLERIAHERTNERLSRHHRNHLAKKEREANEALRKAQEAQAQKEKQ